MMRYTVHVYPVVRVAVTGIEAASQEEAMEKADKTDFHAIFDHLGDNIEYAEDIDCFHVDEENDPEYERSAWYDKHYAPL